MRVNMNKTKVMISGEQQKVMHKAVRWPCGVCGKSVGNNSIQCTSCQKWVHRKCSGKKGSMYKVMKTFICRGYVIPVTGTGHTSSDIGPSANLELVDKFCYLGDMLSVNGDADAAVEARIQTGWNKFRQLVLLLTNTDISLIMANFRPISNLNNISKIIERLFLSRIQPHVCSSGNFSPTQSAY